eukprot:365815-Chlamydomonas_euryale.AAC.6
MLLLAPPPTHNSHTTVGRCAWSSSSLSLHACLHAPPPPPLHTCSPHAVPHDPAHLVVQQLEPPRVALGRVVDVERVGLVARGVGEQREGLERRRVMQHADVECHAHRGAAAPGAVVRRRGRPRRRVAPAATGRRRRGRHRGVAATGSPRPGANRRCAISAAVGVGSVGVRDIIAVVAAAAAASEVARRWTAAAAAAAAAVELRGRMLDARRLHRRGAHLHELLHPGDLFIDVRDGRADNLAARKWRAHAEALHEACTHLGGRGQWGGSGAGEAVQGR